MEIYIYILNGKKIGSQSCSSPTFAPWITNAKNTVLVGKTWLKNQPHIKLGITKRYLKNVKEGLLLNQPMIYNYFNIT